RVLCGVGKRVRRLTVPAKRHGANLELPLAGERARRSVSEAERHRAVDAAATTAVAHAHGEHVPPGAQCAGGDAILALQVVSVRASDLAAVEPGDVVVVD